LKHDPIVVEFVIFGLVRGAESEQAFHLHGPVVGGQVEMATVLGGLEFVDLEARPACSAQPVLYLLGFPPAPPVWPSSTSTPPSPRSGRVVTARALARVTIEAGAEERAGVSRSYVSHWIGGTTPSDRAPALLCEALARRLGRPIALHDVGLTPTPAPGPVALDWQVDTLVSLDDLGRLDVDMDRRRALETAIFSVADLRRCPKTPGGRTCSAAPTHAVQAAPDWSGVAMSRPFEKWCRSSRKSTSGAVVDTREPPWRSTSARTR
jgi:hypothetical protein